MGKSQAVKLGPFTGGMNSASDASTVADTELVDCVNLELDLDGSLRCRPSLVRTVDNSTVTTERLIAIGSAVLGSSTYVIMSNANGTYAFDGTSYITIRDGLSSRCAVQYRDLIFIIATPGSSQNGGYWDGTTFTFDNNMPRGGSMLAFKGRLWTVPGEEQTGAAAHNLRFTDPIGATPTPLVWTSTNLIAVAPGNGQKLIDLCINNDNIMLFKQGSTHVLAYDTSVEDAVLREINDTIGASTYHCVVSYENAFFVLCEGEVYAAENYTYSRLNAKVPFYLDLSVPSVGSVRKEPVSLSIVGDRIIVNYFNRMYVYGLLTKTWSRWALGLEAGESRQYNTTGRWVELPKTTLTTDNTKYIAGSTLDNDEFVYVMYESQNDSVVTSGDYLAQCFIVTKNYDFGDSAHFKRLMWWGADILSGRPVIGTAVPVTTRYRAHWYDIQGSTWISLRTRLWGSILGDAPGLSTTIDDRSVIRKFVKFLKSLRFRQIYFKIELSSDCTRNDGPARVFSLTPVIGLKELVTKESN